MTISIGTLFTAQTASQLLTLGLEVASALGLPVTAWQTNSPSRTLFKFLADALALRETLIGEFISSGFVSTAEGDWLTVVALELYGVTRTEATYSTPSVTLSNGGAGAYSRAAGEVVVKSTASGVTFRSTEALSLASGPGTTATITLVADVAGSTGTVGANDIDEVVTTMIGVTATASTAAVATDQQSDASLRAECTDTLGALSPNGAPDAYNYVVKNSALTGVTDITRALTVPDSSTGLVVVYVAGDSGPVEGTSVTAAQAAVNLWAVPACITALVYNSVSEPQTITMSVTCTDYPASTDADVEALIAAHFSTLDIGGYVSQSALISICHQYLVDAGATDVLVSISSPASHSLVAGYIATVGACTITQGE